ncbi:MAG: sulfite exporter TauE/SafE family protein [Dermatophilaceae bacterium]|nr:sulfite exporter TauE/SafE family protein [Intrasporangiaceae bacterium]
MQTTDQLTIPVTGMTCDSCEKRVSKALLRLPGVEGVTVSAARGRADLRGHALPDRARIEAAVRRAGYEPTAPPWLTRDPSVWRTVLVAAVVVAALAWVVVTFAPGALTAGMARPEQGGLLLVLVLGLTAGVSTCMAMVGVLVLGFSAAHAGSLAASGRTGLSLITRLRPQLAFNLGRIVGFGILGALLGALGSTMSLPTRVMAIVVLAVAVVMFLLGVRLTGLSPRVAGWSPRLPGGISRVLGVDTASEGSYSHGRTALVGAATFFLPCGFTQAVQIYALSTASPVAAGLIMATFAIGTTPGLLALASVPELTTGARQATVLRVVGVVVLAFAVLNLSSSANLLGLSDRTSQTSALVATDNVTVRDGIQTVRMTQVTGGYEPADTVLYAGLPTTWAIESTSPFDCSAFIRVPRLGVSADLVEGPNTVDLPALDPGTIPFTCVMGMYSGTLVVIDQPPAATG